MDIFEEGAARSASDKAKHQEEYTTKILAWDVAARKLWSVLRQIPEFHRRLTDAEIPTDIHLYTYEEQEVKERIPGTGFIRNRTRRVHKNLPTTVAGEGWILYERTHRVPLPDHSRGDSWGAGFGYDYYGFALLTSGAVVCFQKLRGQTEYERTSDYEVTKIVDDPLPSWWHKIDNRPANLADWGQELRELEATVRAAGGEYTPQYPRKSYDIYSFNIYALGYELEQSLVNAVTKYLA